MTRVLLIAEAANPEWNSVPLEGWSHSQAILSAVSGHLVTQVRNREAVIRAGMIEGKHFTTIDSERMARPIWRISSALRGGEGKGWTTVQAFSALSYYYFEHVVWKRFGASIRRRQLRHRPSPYTPEPDDPLHHGQQMRTGGNPFCHRATQRWPSLAERVPEGAAQRRKNGLCRCGVLIAYCLGTVQRCDMPQRSSPAPSTLSLKSRNDSKRRSCIFQRMQSTKIAFRPLQRDRSPNCRCSWCLWGVWYHTKVPTC